MSIWLFCFCFVAFVCFCFLHFDTFYVKCVFFFPLYFPPSVACGFGNSMVVVDRTNVGDRLDQVILLNLHVQLSFVRIECFSRSLQSGSGFKCVAFRGLGWHEV